MKRTFVAAAWIAGSTIPLLVATVFIFGCCVLPFHGVIHRLMPLCQTAAAIMTGQHHHDPAAQVPMPAREKRSEEHTSELQSHSDLVCRLLLEKKKKDNKT